MGNLSRIALSLFETCCDSPDRVATAGVVAKCGPNRHRVGARSSLSLDPACKLHLG